MRYLSRALALAALTCVVMMVAAPAVSAAETSNAEYVIIPADDVVRDDLYAGAVRVVVDGRLEGDLTAFAAEEVVINGTVTGSVVAISPRVTINGVVEGSVRAVGTTLDVSGSVSGDVVAVVGTATLAAGSRVGGDVLVWAWRLTSLGSIGENLEGTQRNLALAGGVDGDVDVTVSRLRIVDELIVGGDLTYRSGNEASGLEDAEVSGAVVQKSPMAPNLRVRALWVLGRLMVTLFLTIAALAVAYGWPGRTGAAVTSVGRHPVRRWLSGATVVFAPLLLGAVTGIMLGLAPAAAAFPLLVVLVPAILALAGVCFAVCFVAGIPVVGWLGQKLFRRNDLYVSILTGSLLVGGLWWLPVVGWLVPVLVLPLGLGAWFATFRQSAPEAGSAESESTQAV